MKKIFLLLLTLLTLGCNREIKKPDNLMDRDFFKKVLAEMYVYKQAPAVANMSGLEQDKISMAVLKKNNVTPTQFKASLEYYMVENIELEKILKEIQDSLNLFLPEKEKQEEELMLNELEVK